MTKPRIVVDRVEGPVAVLEVDGRLVDVPAALLPVGAREGTVLSFSIESESTAPVSREQLDRMQRAGGIDKDFSF